MSIPQCNQTFEFITLGIPTCSLGIGRCAYAHRQIHFSGPSSGVRSAQPPALELCGFGMGCTPSSVSSASVKSETVHAGDAPGDDGLVRLSDSGLMLESKNGSGEVCASVRNCKNNKVQCSGFHGKDKGDAGGPAAGQDEESESESASLLCANLRRNFMPSRHGSRSSSECRRKGSSTGGGGGKLALTTTAEEQSENFLSSEDGCDNNPLLRRFANPAPAEVVATTTTHGSSTGILSGQQNLTHYVQLQQYHPFQGAGRNLSSQVAEKVSPTLIVHDGAAVAIKKKVPSMWTGN